MPPLPRPDAVPADQARFDFQLKMLESGAAEVQSQISRLDDLLFKLQASFVGVWVGTVGWAVTIESRYLLPVAAIVALTFWVFEGVYRGAQARFLDRARTLTVLFNDRETLDRCFAARELPRDVVFPVSLPLTDRDRARLYARGLLAPTTATLYLSVLLVTYLPWLAVPFGR